MTIKSRLNTVVVLFVVTVSLLFGLLLHTTFQISNQLNRIDKVNRFSKTVSELNIITEQYLAYDEPRYLDTWNKLYGKMQQQVKEISQFPTRNVVTNAMPSIREAFQLIKKVRNNPRIYDDPEKRKRLLERASARIRSDIQLLLSVSHRLEEHRRESVREIQVNQRTQALLIMVPAIGLVIYLIFRVRYRILESLRKLVEGTRKIAQGDFDREIDIDGSDEHARLAEDFNRMTEKLRKHIRKEQNLRKEAEQHQKRWETLVEQDPSLIVIHKQGNIKFINSGGLEIMGAKSAEQVKGTRVFDYLDEAEDKKALERIRLIEQKSEKPSPTVYKVNRFDGQTRYLRIESVPIKYEGKLATQTVGVDITEHITYEERLQESLEEKSVLLQEIHHRVKNNLAVISGMLELQAMESDDEKLTSHLHDSQLRVQSMGLIHELLYQSESFSELEFAEHIKQLVSTIKDTILTDTNITFEYDLEDVYLNVNQAIPCALIVNELVSNAFKHAFEGREKGRISISMHREGDMLELSICDNGKGLPEEFDLSNAESMGMNIINTLVQQLEADVEIESGHGSKVTIRFEIANIKGSGGARF